METSANEIKHSDSKIVAEKTTSSVLGISNPKITITKTAYNLTPLKRSIIQNQQQETQESDVSQSSQIQKVQSQLSPKKGFATSTTGSSPPTKVIFQTDKPIIKPVSKPILTTGDYNVAIVAAKRPHLNITPAQKTAETSTSSSATSASNNNLTIKVTSSESKKEPNKPRDKIRNKSEISGPLSTARTILVRRAPHCLSCFNQSEENDLSDSNRASIPSYNEVASKEAMNECTFIARSVKNSNPDDEDWESKVSQVGWSNMQKTLFTKMVCILDNDQLGRLSNIGRQGEAIHRRSIVNRSAARMRKILASIGWDIRLTQWLHCLLLENLPPSYMSSYLDILQTLKSKLPFLMDKVVFSRTVNSAQELLAPVMKKKWDLQIATKARKLQQNSVILALPSIPISGPVPHRLQKWYQHLATITQIIQVSLPMTGSHMFRQPLEYVAEQIVSLTRVKIQELRNENSTRKIILVGFNAGASMALQVAMSENVACIVCMGFAYNTYNGVRGAPDDRILDIKIPILFVIGQNSDRTSIEEVEGLRERMQSETSLVIVGGADDVLRVPKDRCRIENVTQSMVEVMVVDEVYDFIKRMLTNPPGPRVPIPINSSIYAKQKSAAGDKNVIQQRKRKQQTQNSDDQEAGIVPPKMKYFTSKYQNFTLEKKIKHKKDHDQMKIKRMVGRPRTKRLPNTSGLIQLSSTGNATVPTTASVIQIGKTSFNAKTTFTSSKLTDDDLNRAIESIIKTDANNVSIGGQTMSTIADNATNKQKYYTNIELVNATKMTPMASGNRFVNTQQKQLIITGSAQGTGVSTTKIKMLPSNEFVQLKPTTPQTSSRIFSIKPTSLTPVSSTNSRFLNVTTTAMSTSPNAGQHVFTLKTPTGHTTQFATAIGGHTKYAVVKNTGTTVGSSASVQLKSSIKPLISTSTITTHQISNSGSTSIDNIQSSNVDLTNIIDMPILFADNEGNLSEDVNSSCTNTNPNSVSFNIGQTIGSGNVKSSTKSGLGPLIISQKVIREATKPIPATIETTEFSQLPVTSINSTGTFVINKSGTIQGNSKPNKLVYINRMKSLSNIVARPNIVQNIPKYTKVVVSTPKIPTATVVNARSINNEFNSNVNVTLPTTSTVVKQINLKNLQPTIMINSSTGTGMSTSSTTIAKTITRPSSITNPLTGITRSSGILNVETKNLPQVHIIKKGSLASVLSAQSNKTPVRNIVLKSGGLKQLPPNVSSQLLNRNLTIRKLVNIVPVTKTTVLSVNNSIQETTNAKSIMSSKTNVIPTRTTTATNNVESLNDTFLENNDDINLILSSVTTDESTTSTTTTTTTTTVTTPVKVGPVQTSPKIITLNSINGTIHLSEND